jgi:hypothetical protein
MIVGKALLRPRGMNRSNATHNTTSENVPHARGDELSLNSYINGSGSIDFPQSLTMIPLITIANSDQKECLL